MTALLFQPTRIGGLALKNRLVRSATYDGGTDRNGHVTPWQVRLYETLAQGGTGLIVSGMASVHPSGRVARYQNVISEDAAIAGMTALAGAVHDGDGALVLQIAHAGGEAHVYQRHLKRQAVAPSRLPENAHFEHPHRALTIEEIEEIVQSFGHAAGRAKAAGMDGVQVHGAHAYLVSQFLSPHTNRRDDAWGGTLERRFHFLSEVYQAIRKTVGPDYPVMIKLGVADGFEGGLSFDEGLQIARWCSELGFDAIEVSQGLRGAGYGQTEFRTRINAREKEAYFRAWAQAVKEKVTASVWMVGGLRSPDVIAAALTDKQADLAALSRPLIREPDLVARWQQGENAVSRCISCNQCLEGLHRGKRLHCVVEKADADR